MTFVTSVADALLCLCKDPGQSWVSLSLVSSQDRSAPEGGLARHEQVRRAMRRASAGRAMVAIAVFAPVLLILAWFLLSRASVGGHHLAGAKWPWIVADVAVLLGGMRMMRGEDL